MNSSTLLNNLGSNIRSYRKRKGLTIDELAEMSSLSGKYLQGVEVGIRNISIKNLNKVAISLNISPDILLNIDTKSLENKEEKIFTISEKLKHFEITKLDFIGNMLDNLGDVMTSSGKEIKVEKTTKKIKDNK